MTEVSDRLQVIVPSTDLLLDSIDSIGLIEGEDIPVVCVCESYSSS